MPWPRAEPGNKRSLHPRFWTCWPRAVPQSRNTAGCPEMCPPGPPPPCAAALRVRRAVTISRQAGCGAVTVAEKLASYLQQHAPHEGVAWTIFDRELMDKVLADHNLPKYLAKFLPEDRASQIEDTLADIFGVPF